MSTGKKKKVGEKKMLATRGRSRYEVSAEKFCETYRDSNSYEEVAKKLGMPVEIVYARVAKYRRMGAKLKKMRQPSREKLDVESLNRILGEHQERGELEEPKNEVLEELRKLARELREALAKQKDKS